MTSPFCSASCTAISATARIRRGPGRRVNVRQRHQLLPADPAAGHARVGFSATATYWLSRLPGAALPMRAGGGRRDAGRARRVPRPGDGRLGYQHPARPCRPVAAGRQAGARQLLRGRGRPLPRRHRRHQHVRRVRPPHWRWLRDTGAISDDEYRAATFPQFYKTPEEFAAPFLSAHSPVSLAGLRLDHIDRRASPAAPCRRLQAAGRRARVRQGLRADAALVDRRHVWAPSTSRAGC